MKQPVKTCVIGVLCICLLGSMPAMAQDLTSPIWEVADEIRTLLLNAQRQLFSAQRAENPTLNYQSAYDYVRQAQQHYVTVLQADIQKYANSQDQHILNLFDEAQQVALQGDLLQLSFLRGYVWTSLLHASYLTTLRALADSAYDVAQNWLSLRDYRQATRVNIILSPSAKTILSLMQNTIPYDEGFALIDNDLRDAYYFRLRQSLSELQTAIGNDYWVRSAEWLGQAYGYFDLFADDYNQKLGNIEIPRNALHQIQVAIFANDTILADSSLSTFRSALTNYQPVTFSQEQIGERAQLLYIFTDLVYIEYKDGVRNGQITIPIEYQEATTFLAQAGSLYEELRPLITKVDPTQADLLASYLVQIDNLVKNVGDSGELRILVENAKRVISSSNRTLNKKVS
jgi:high-affinity iron transporter